MGLNQRSATGPVEPRSPSTTSCDRSASKYRPCTVAALRSGEANFSTGFRAGSVAADDGSVRRSMTVSPPPALAEPGRTLNTDCPSDLTRSASSTPASCNTVPETAAAASATAPLPAEGEAATITVKFNAALGLLLASSAVRNCSTSAASVTGLSAQAACGTSGVGAGAGAGAAAPEPPPQAASPTATAATDAANTARPHTRFKNNKSTIRMAFLHRTDTTPIPGTQHCGPHRFIVPQAWRCHKHARMGGGRQIHTISIAVCAYPSGENGVFIYFHPPTAAIPPWQTR